jgi:predicted DNA-binding protein
MSGKHKKETEPFTLYLPLEMIQSLRELSAKTMAPVSAHIRAAIADYLKVKR